MTLEAAPMPTQANDSEVSLLGAAMSGYPALDDLLDVVDPADFYTHHNGEIWRAIATLHREGTPPDVVAVGSHLAEHGIRYDAVRLFNMTQLVPIISQAEFYAQQVTMAAGLRRLQDAGIKVGQIASTPGDLADKQERARQAIDEACQGRTLSRARLLADLLEDVLDVAENGAGEVLSTPWPDVDRVIGGIAPGRLVVIGARPGIGKSVAGTNLALHMAHHHGHAVLLASMEMPEREVMQRILACQAEVSLTALQNARMEESDWAKVARHQATISGLPIAVEDKPDQTITAIRSAARNLQRERDDLALIVVDYLQLLTPAERRKNRAEEVAEMSRGLKLLARETGACVVAMAQLNRDAAKNEKPRSSDLRESGGIEADADQVLLLHQPDDAVPEIEVLVDKNRHGPKGRAVLQMAGHYAQLRSVWRG